MSEGMDKFGSYYPHMKHQLSGVSYMETMLAILSPGSVEGPKLVSRHSLKALCYDSRVRERVFVTCPLPLIRAVHDTVVCAKDIFEAGGNPSVADSYTREWILADILHFQPSEGTEDVRKLYYSGRPM
jgi:hypothetical protein